MSHPNPTVEYQDEEGMERSAVRANHRQHILEAAQGVIDKTGELVQSHIAMTSALKLTDNDNVTKALETLHISISATLDAMEEQLNADLQREQQAGAG